MFLRADRYSMREYSSTKSGRRLAGWGSTQGSSPSLLVAPAGRLNNRAIILLQVLLLLSLQSSILEWSGISSHTYVSLEKLFPRQNKRKNRTGHGLDHLLYSEYMLSCVCASALPPLESHAGATQGSRNFQQPLLRWSSFLPISSVTTRQDRAVTLCRYTATGIIILDTCCTLFCCWDCGWKQKQMLHQTVDFPHHHRPHIMKLTSASERRRAAACHHSTCCRTKILCWSSRWCSKALSWPSIPRCLGTPTPKNRSGIPAYWTSLLLPDDVRDGVHQQQVSGINEGIQIYS